MTIFQDQFARFPIGQLPFDYSAVGEYHCLDLPGLPAGWVETTNHTGWGALGNWQIVEDGGRRVMQQARLREHGTPMLAAGDLRWRDIVLESDIRLLSRKTEAGLLLRYENNRTHYALRLHGDGSACLLRRRHEEHVRLAEASWHPRLIATTHCASRSKAIPSKSQSTASACSAPKTRPCPRAASASLPPDRPALPVSRSAPPNLSARASTRPPAPTPASSRPRAGATPSPSSGVASTPPTSAPAVTSASATSMATAASRSCSPNTPACSTAATSRS